LLLVPALHPKNVKASQQNHVGGAMSQHVDYVAKMLMQFIFDDLQHQVTDCQTLQHL